MKTKVGVIADSLKALRVRHCMTHETLSRLSNIPVATLQSYETGAVAMDADDAWALADTFGITMDEFLGRTPLNKKGCDAMDSTAVWDRPEQEPVAPSEDGAPQVPETAGNAEAADTVRSAEDAEKLLGIPVIACFPSAGEAE